MAKVATFHGESRIEIKATADAAGLLGLVQMTWEGQSAGDFRITVTETAYATGVPANPLPGYPLITEFRRVAGVSYVQDLTTGTGGWETLPEAEAPEGDSLLHMMFPWLSSLEDLTAVTDLLHGAQVYRIAAVMPKSEPSVSAKGERITLWVTPLEMLILRMEGESEQSRVGYAHLFPGEEMIEDDPRTVFVRSTVEFSRFDEPVNIETPSVKPP
jgi:hypothetical protein